MGAGYGTSQANWGSFSVFAHFPSCVRRWLATSLKKTTGHWVPGCQSSAASGVAELLKIIFLQMIAHPSELGGIAGSYWAVCGDEASQDVLRWVPGTRGKSLTENAGIPR